MLLAHTIDINRNDHCARLLSSTVTPTTFENVDELSQGTKVALERAGMVEMTEIQQLTLNPILNGQDVTARARTGTGKV
jgi:superfamily II DNA/RNA helicase